jgi:hypothetical protein
MTKQRSQKKITNKPAPYVAGLYSVQAVGEGGVPDVTAYRASLREALEWKTREAKRGLFSKFLLRHGVDAWDVYAADGKLEYLCNSVASELPSEKNTAVDVVKSVLEKEASEVVGKGFTLIAVAENHVGSSTVDHANFGAMVTKMIRDVDDEDLIHVCVVSSATWPCRVMGLFVNLNSASEDMQNLYLDRYKELIGKIPLDEVYYRNMLSNRLCESHASLLADIYYDASVASGESDDDALSVKMNILMLMSNAKKLLLAESAVRICYDDITTTDKFEKFDTEKMRKHAHELMETYRSARDS